MDTGFPETDPWVQHESGFGDACGSSSIRSTSQVGCHLGHDIVVDGTGCHSPARTPPMR